MSYQPVWPVPRRGESAINSCLLTGAGLKPPFVGTPANAGRCAGRRRTETYATVLRVIKDYGRFLSAQCRRLGPKVGNGLLFRRWGEERMGMRATCHARPFKGMPLVSGLLESERRGSHSVAVDN